MGKGSKYLDTDPKRWAWVYGIDKDAPRKRPVRRRRRPDDEDQDSAAARAMAEAARILAYQRIE